MAKLNRLLPIAALAGLGALIFFLRLHTYEEPLERDITTYAVIAHEMTAGKALYSDLWDHKPPAIHVTYAAAELVAGYGRDSIFLMNILAAVATMLGCYFTASAGGGGRTGGFIAAALWALASGDLALEGNQPNTEVFLNAFLTAAFAIVVRAKDGNLGLRNALLVGLLFAAASLYKQVVVVQAALVALAYLASAATGARKKALFDVATIGLVGVAAWGLTFTYFAARGHASAFYEAVFVYNRWYSGELLANLGQITSWPDVSPEVLAVILSIGTLATVGLILGLAAGPRRPWVLLFTFVIATHVAVLLPGRFFPHYYQLWLPPLAIGAAWAVTLLKRVLPMRVSWLSYGVAGAACCVLVMLEAPYYQIPAESWSAQKYGTIFLETDNLANKIDRLLPAGATFYEWGNESGLYFASGRQPPSGIVFAYPMLAGPLAAKLSRRLLSDLEKGQPDLIVADAQTLAHTPREHPLAIWLKANYEPFSRTQRFLLFERKGTKAAGRLATAAAN